MPFGIGYDIILTIARLSLHGFYREVKTIGYENVPKEAPIIACSNHSNMIVDPAVVATTFPYKRKVHFWAKNSIFQNKYARAILFNSGVVPVDRTTKNNQSLFSSTLEVLRLGEVVAVFPEGTSHSEPKLLSIRDGASWSALSYMRFIAEEIKESSQSNGDTLTNGIKTAKRKRFPPPKVYIVPVGITYVQKSKYRSLVISSFGPAIDVEPYYQKFENDERETVKLLTKHVEEEMKKLTINARDWETSNAANMARMLLFSEDVALEDYVKITQSLVNFFAAPTSDEVISVKNLLHEYKTTLDTLCLSNIDIAQYEKRELSLHWAFYTFLSEFLKSLIQLPFFLPGLLFHWPIYIIGKISAKYEIYEESKAQNKILLGLGWLFAAYLALFFSVWIAMSFTPLGFMLAGSFVFIFAWYHIALVDSHYDTFKDVISSYRIFAALANGKGTDHREKIENLVLTRRTCIGYLEKIANDHRHKSEDLRLVLEYRERVYGSFYQNGANGVEIMNRKTEGKKLQ
ncbi:hypothetical protein G9A89_000843 [Geosiphon pyriformis]|nr:hypothetical protein G9A89_000843 [Geosiphon pyriformis]